MNIPLPVFDLAQISPLLASGPQMNFWLAVVGSCVLWGGLAFAVVTLSVLAFRSVGRLMEALKLAGIRRRRGEAHLALFGKVQGPDADLAAEFLKRVNDRLGKFAFGMQLRGEAAPLEAWAWQTAPEEREGRRALATVERTLTRTEGEVAVWGMTTPARRKQPASLELIIATAARPGRPAAPPRRVKVMGEAATWSGMTVDAVAYLMAKSLQPALGRPSDFRPERLRPIVEALDVLVAAEVPLDAASRAELIDDFAAGALHLGEVLGAAAWLEKAVRARIAALEGMDRGAAPGRWVSAKVDLGRAMALLYEIRFDPVKMQEAIGHLKDGVEALRAEPALIRAEGASRAINRAERALADRRRFSIRWPS
jgi:hypothetical protein